MMSSPESYFRIRAHRPKSSVPGKWPQILIGQYREPAEAADAAEVWLNAFGVPGQSFCDLLFNGDGEPHSSVFALGHRVFGIWNRDAVPWPIDYFDDGSGEKQGEKLNEHPRFQALGSDDPVQQDSDEGENKKSEQSDTMKLDGMDDSDDDEEGFDDDSDEYEEDDGEDSDGSENDGESDTEDDEMPRLKLFAKMRTPKSWRKRAESDYDKERNVFAMKIGVLDEKGETPGKQESNTLVEIQFIEDEKTRKHGVMRMRVPDGVVFEQKGSWWTANVPYDG